MTNNIEHLYIIGNGFDIFTGLKTRYLDFRWWLENNYIFVYEALSSVYGTDGEWWNDFESQLGKLNVEQYISDYTPKFQSIDELTKKIRENREFEKNNNLPHNVLFSNPCSSRLKGLLDILHYCFEKWVQSVQNSFTNPKYTHLESCNSFFINFNYTDTLEALYNIPEERVIHIHGRASKHDHLIFGHNKHLFGDKKTGYEGEKVSEVLNQYEKNPFMNIPNGLENIINRVKFIHVLGFSFSDVDMPYLDWIVENTGKDCKWEISWHSKEDDKRINSFVFDRPSILKRVNRIQITEISSTDNEYIQNKFHFLKY